MKLYIVRHGIAIDREDPKCPPDPERYLTAEGVEKTRQVAKVFLFGHAPQLDDLIATALGSKRHLTALKKAGVAFLELRRLSPPIGELVWLGTPKLLRRSGK